MLEWRFVRAKISLATTSSLGNIYFKRKRHVQPVKYRGWTRSSSCYLFLPLSLGEMAGPYFRTSKPHSPMSFLLHSFLEERTTQEPGNPGNGGSGPLVNFVSLRQSLQERSRPHVNYAVSSGSSSGLLIGLRNSEHRDIPQLLLGHAGKICLFGRGPQPKHKDVLPIVFASALTENWLHGPRARPGEPRSLSWPLGSPAA